MPISFSPEPGGVELAAGVRVAASAMRFQFDRSSGPGGQNVNKVNTKAQLWVPLSALEGLSGAARRRVAEMAGRRLTAAGEIHIVADTARTQEGNRAAVMERLRQLLTAAMHRPKPRRKTRPTLASKKRRLEAKKHRGQIKSLRRSDRGD